MKYTDKIVWITGASSGIGEALAYEYSKRGATLILSSRNEQELQRVKNQCNLFGAQAHVFPLDLTDNQQILTVSNTVLSQFGRIDILVNNGGISQRSFVVDTPIENDRKIMEIDYFGHVALTKQVLPVMVRQKSGHIIVMSSLSGLFGFQQRSAYCAAKHALHGFFEALRAEHYFDNISVTLVCPGRVHTKISYSALTASGAPHGKMDDAQLNGVPADVAARKIVNAAERNKKIYKIGGKELLMYYFKKYIPALFYYLAPRVKPN